MATTINNIWQKTKKENGAKLVVANEPGEFNPYTVTAHVTAQTTGEETTEHIEGWTYGETALGYYQNATGEYVPIHLPTGYPLSGTPMSKKTCEAYLRELAVKLDWHGVDETGPSEKVMPDLVKIEKKYSKL